MTSTADKIAQLAPLVNTSGSSKNNHADE